ncbi:MAG: hypothetical protein IH604_08950 [Burkholderiales bacterium]|nr:hypothetical protein [Burkholderiales bacterium]
MKDVHGCYYAIPRNCAAETIANRFTLTARSIQESLSNSFLIPAPPFNSSFLADFVQQSVFLLVDLAARPIEDAPNLAPIQVE